MLLKKLTHIGCLITGDRFYFAADKSKTAWEVRYHSTKIATMKKTSRCKRDDGKLETFDSNAMVVYLRKKTTKEVIVQPLLFNVERSKRKRRKVK